MKQDYGIAKWGGSDDDAHPDARGKKERLSNRPRRITGSEAPFKSLEINDYPVSQYVAIL